MSFSSFSVKSVTLFYNTRETAAQGPEWTLVMYLSNHDKNLFTMCDIIIIIIV